MFFSNPNEDVSARLKQWWKSVPFFTTFLIYLTSSMYLLTLMLPILSAYFVLNLEGIFIFRYIWQLFTFQYMHPQLLNLLFVYLSYLQVACRSERKLGTVRFISFFIANNFIIGCLFTIVTLGLIQIRLPINFMMFCFGLWPITMVEIVLRCNQNPEELTQFMCFPWKIKQKYYPWVFFLMFSLFFGLITNLLVGIIVGYLNLWGLMKWAVINESIAKKFENCCFLAFKGLNSFIMVDNAGNEEPGLAPVSSIQIQSRVERPPVVPFSGTGNRLGGDAALPQTNSYSKLNLTENP